MKIGEPRLADRIQKALVTLTENELALADALSLKPDVAAFESLRRFADMAGVNPSTLSRFVSKLGYNSYRDLQLELRGAVTRMIPSPVNRAQLADDKIDVAASLQQSLEDDLTQLQQLRDLASSDVLLKAVKLIADAKGTIYVIGNGWSRSFADMLAHRLALCRPRVESSSSLDLLGYGKFAECGANDCAIAIATRRYTKNTITMVSALRRRNVPTIAITDASTSPLLREASLALVVANMRAGLFDSPTPVAAAIHLLCVGVSRRLHAGVMKRFSQVDRLSEELGTFDA